LLGGLFDECRLKTELIRNLLYVFVIHISLILRLKTKVIR
jgi:hypothetical protein